MWIVNQGDLADSSCICKQRPQFKTKKKKEYWGKKVKFDAYVQEYVIKKLKSKKKKCVKEFNFLFSLFLSMKPVSNLGARCHKRFFVSPLIF